MGSVWRLPYLTPWGRQETGEDSPEGWQQILPYAWWHSHEEYADQ